MKKTKSDSDSVKTKPAPEISVAVRDACEDSLELAKGLDSLFWLIATSTEGLTPASATAMELISARLVERLTIINSCLNGKKE